MIDEPAAPDVVAAHVSIPQAALDRLMRVTVEAVSRDADDPSLYGADSPWI